MPSLEPSDGSDYGWSWLEIKRFWLLVSFGFAEISASA
jgi:hypothetical protein